MTRAFRRRSLVLLAILAVLLWVAAAAAVLLRARADAYDGLEQIERLEDGEGPTALVDGAAVRRLQVAADEFASARARMRSPLLTPLRALPVVGRQIRASHRVVAAASVVSGTGAQAAARVDEELGRRLDGGVGRVRLLRVVAAAADDALRDIRALDRTPGRALLAPLRDANRRMLRELDQIERTLERSSTAAKGLAAFLGGPSRYLLLAANNAEMRSGSGAFLLAGEMTVRDGEIDVGELIQTKDLLLPPGAVEPDGDHAARWGFLQPSQEWRNLGLTPRFDVTASLASKMWEATGRPAVDGVLALDPIALEAIVASTGAVEVEGRRYDERNIARELLVGQYEEFLASRDQTARRDRLGALARVVVARLGDGTGDPARLAGDLREAAAGRHLLAWSSRREHQAAWEAASVSGRMKRDGLLLSVINRGGGQGGGKLDPYLDVAAKLERELRADGVAEYALEVDVRNKVAPGHRTYVEASEDAVIRHGVYKGILSVVLPGWARNSRIEGVDRLLVAGADGPNRVVGALMEVPAGTSTKSVVRFEGPTGQNSLYIASSARYPHTEWRFAGEMWRDSHARWISIPNSRSEDR